MSTTSKPASVTVSLNGTEITAPGKFSEKQKAKGKEYFWYEAAQQGQIGNDKTIEQALLDATVVFNGAVLPPSSKSVVDGQRIVRISGPRLYKAGDKAVLQGRAHAGQAVSGTGGNQTISFWDTIEGGALDGYTIRVTLTGIAKDDGDIVTVAVACQPMVSGGGRQRRLVGSASGPIGF